VVIISSSAAVGTFGPHAPPGKIYTEEDWNRVTIEQAGVAFAKGVKGHAYLASKMYAERAAWNLKGTHKEHI
jgi:hypothetical protein